MSKEQPSTTSLFAHGGSISVVMRIFMMIDVLLCVGHSRLGDKRGAVSTLGADEYQYNTQVAEILSDYLSDKTIISDICSHYPTRGYTSAMKWVGKRCRELQAKVAVELHFNAASRASASGHEWLIYKTSKKGYELARCFESAMVSERPEAARRGVKSLFSSADRGYGFVAYTPCPAVVLEPFFGSNAAESQEFIEDPEKLARIYSSALTTYFERLDS